MQTIHVNSVSEAVDVIDQHMQKQDAIGFHIATAGLVIDVRKAPNNICSMHMYKDMCWQGETKISTEMLCGKGGRVDREFSVMGGIPQVILY